MYEYWLYLSNPGNIIDAERELKYKNNIEFERDNLKFHFKTSSDATKALQILKSGNIKVQDKNF